MHAANVRTHRAASSRRPMFSHALQKAVAVLLTRMCSECARMCPNVPRMCARMCKLKLVPFKPLFFHSDPSGNRRSIRSPKAVDVLSIRMCPECVLMCPNVLRVCQTLAEGPDREAAVDVRHDLSKPRGIQLMRLQPKSLGGRGRYLLANPRHV